MAVLCACMHMRVFSLYTAILFYDPFSPCSQTEFNGSLISHIECLLYARYWASREEPDVVTTATRSEANIGLV